MAQHINISTDDSPHALVVGEAVIAPVIQPPEPLMSPILPNILPEIPLIAPNTPFPKMSPKTERDPFPL